MAIDNPSNLMPDQEIIIEGDAGFVPKASPSDAGKVLGVLNSSGDVGWVVDQGGMAQVQSSWVETDTSKVSYIVGKPDLSVYATASSVETALAGKQDTISDLSDIRAGASAGSTAVQPAELPSSDELVPSASSVDAGKVLTVGNDGTAGWVTPSAGTVYTAGDGIDITSDVISADVDGVTIGIDASTKKIKSLQTIPSVDQTYNASSTNAQSGTAVAGAIAAISVDEVPDVTSSDDGKVLKASYSGGQGSYAWGTDSDTTYTAGNMIAINANSANAIGVSTTAGITDIQVVNELPASPVATVLYLIPET